MRRLAALLRGRCNGSRRALFPSRCLRRRSRGVGVWQIRACRGSGEGGESVCCRPVKSRAAYSMQKFKKCKPQIRFSYRGPLADLGLVFIQHPNGLVIFSRYFRYVLIDRTRYCVMNDRGRSKTYTRANPEKMERDNRYCNNVPGKGFVEVNPGIHRIQPMKPGILKG